MASGDDVLARKYVEFAQRGMGSIVEYTKSLREELTRAKQAGSDLKKALADGSYAKVANQLVQLRKQYAAMKQAARLTDLIAEHGRFAGTLKYGQERMAGLTKAASIGFATVTATTLGWVTAGMAGTVEANRLQTAFTYLSRGIASTFKPTIDSFTDALFRVGKWFNMLTGDEQKSLRVTVLWTAGILGGIVALSALAKWLAWLASGLGVVRTALVGSAVASSVATKAMVNHTVAASFQTRALAANTAATNANNAAKMKASAAGGAGGFGKGALKAAGIAGSIYAVADLLADQITPEGQQKEKYGNYLDRGVGSNFRFIKGGFRNTFGRLGMSRSEVNKANEVDMLTEKDKYGFASERDKKRLAELKGDKSEASRVSVMPEGFGEIGSTFERLQVEFLKLSDPAKEQALDIAKIKDILETVASSFGLNLKMKPMK